MLPVMFGPMWDPEVTVGGIDAGLVVIALSLILMSIGLVWIRRLTAGEPEIKSFWATDGGRRRFNPPLIAGLVLAVTAAALFLVLRP
jgi:uncharacterized membrane protein